MSTDPQPAYRPISTPLTVEDRLVNLEAQQLAQASSFLRSISASHKSQTDTEGDLRWCMREINALHSMLRVFALLNVMLVCLLVILVLRELTR